MTEQSYTLRVSIGASPEAVYAALTDAAAVRAWLAEHAEVSVGEQVFEFWGRYTPDGERGRQRLLSVEPGRGLSFSWILQGAVTEVGIALEPRDGSTALTLTHAGVPARAPGGAWVRDMLMLALANLASYCEGRGLAPMCDFTAPRAGEVRAGVDIGVPQAEVFAALTDPEQLNRWIAEQAEVEPHVGGRYDFGWDHGPVKILELEPDRVLAYSWEDTTSDGRADASVVRWELAGSEGQTHLTIVHSGFSAGRAVDGYQLGWQEFLVSLQRMLEIGTAWRPVQQVSS
jgi:uncharacterized protein YndB with AHSA1/START domain